MVLPRGKKLAMGDKGFAKRKIFNHEVKRFCQEGEV
jgi:hypothetical protein